MIKISELRLHDVINVNDGKRLGQSRILILSDQYWPCQICLSFQVTVICFQLCPKNEEVVVPSENV